MRLKKSRRRGYNGTQSAFADFTRPNARGIPVIGPAVVFVNVAMR
jgi:hypothetical protein